MAFFKTIGTAFETAAVGVAAGVQLGFNENANRNCRKAADKCRGHATEVGLDVGGFVTNTVGPALQTAGHAVAVAGCEVADQATFGRVHELKDARDHQVGMMKHAAQNVEAGVARLRSLQTPWYREGPRNMGAWMSNLSDNELVTDLYLPGTHDSGAQHGGDLAECQCWSIDGQLKAGIRCFDIRLRQTGDDLAVHHGKVFQKACFQSIVSSFENFLCINPSEALFVRITGNGCKHDSHREFCEHVYSQLKSQQLWGKLGCDLVGTRLGRIRGRIVGFMCPFNGTTFDAQDEWDLGNAETKWERVCQHARKTREDNKLYVNFLSSCGTNGLAYMTPAGMAYQVNRMAKDHMHDFQPGIVMMDYPGMGIIEDIIKQNFE